MADTLASGVNTQTQDIGPSGGAVPSADIRPQRVHRPAGIRGAQSAYAGPSDGIGPYVVAAVGDAQADLYDARRGVRYAKPRWRGWTHLIFFELSLVLGTLLVVTASGWAETTAASIYAGSVSGLFGASALYHRGQWSTGTARRLQRLDQLMIVVLIGGTATPPILLCLPSPFDVTVTAAMWTLTVAIAAFRVVCLSAAERLVGGMFIALGWTAGAALPWVWMRAGIAPAVLLVIGGAFYTAGALCYHRRRPDPVPAVFGYHEVFHALVCAAAACQYIAIAVFLL